MKWKILIALVVAWDVAMVAASTALVATPNTASWLIPVCAGSLLGHSIQRLHSTWKNR